MLVPAILYREEIIRKFSEYNYSDDMLFYTGWIGSSLPSIEADCDDSHFQYAIVDNEKLIGYFDYQVNWYSSCANCFGLFPLKEITK